MSRSALFLVLLAISLLALACKSEEDRFLEEVAAWHVQWMVENDKNMAAMVRELEGMERPVMNLDNLIELDTYTLAHTTMLSTSASGFTSSLRLLNNIRTDAENNLLRGHFSKADRERMNAYERQMVERRLRYLRGER